MSFSHKSNHADGVVKLLLAGRLMEKGQATELLNDVEQYIKKGHNKFIIHLGNIDYMNSSGLNVMVNILTKARNVGGEVVISNVSRKIQELFLITKLNTLFTICDTIEEAEKYINNQAKNMKADVLLGLQWGDEGKGKIVDVITPHYDIIARFQGGPNAGHTLEFNGMKHVLHTIPSGIFRDEVINIVGNGVVIDPVILKKEIDALLKLNVDVKKKLFVSRKAHIILPTHRLIDAASEASKGKQKIGSTLKGIGPTYMDKTGRNGIRVGDIFLPDFKNRYKTLVEKHKKLLEFYNFQYDLSEYEPAFFDGIEQLKTLSVIDSEHYINQALRQGKKVLAEGAQGTLLDIDFGSYPFVTSSNTTTAGACTGLGIAPNRIGQVIGIFKAYCTRVGSGPFPTELDNEIGEKLRKEGNEFGSTTGRARRCGWIDLPALRYAIMINGVTSLVMMKADVLNSFEYIQVCTHYKINGQLTPNMPYDLCVEEAIPIYKEMKGWNCSLKEIDSEEKMPSELKNYIAYLEQELEVPISIVSLGPDRNQTIIRNAEIYS